MPPKKTVTKPVAAKETKAKAPVKETKAKAPVKETKAKAEVKETKAKAEVKELKETNVPPPPEPKATKAKPVIKAAKSAKPLGDFKYIRFLDDSYLNDQYQLLGIKKEINTTDFLPFSISNVDKSLANAMRRICTAEIKTIAIDPKDIVIEHNTSQYNQEMLCQNRFTFITIDCDYIEKMKINVDDLFFYISDTNNIAEPLKNTGQNIMIVFIHQYLKAYYGDKPMDITKICPYNSPLLTLNPNETIYVKMTPSYGTGNMHIRWQSSMTMYKFGTEMDASRAAGEGHEPETNQQLMNYIGKEKNNPDTFILTIESVGKMTAINVLVNGIKTLKESIANLKKECLVGDSDKIFEDIENKIPNLARINIVGEDFTLGYLLETACMDVIKDLVTVCIKENVPNVANRKMEEQNLLLETFAAFRKLHPLDKFSELDIKTPAKYEFIFNDEYDRLDPAMRIAVLAMDRIIILCDDLLADVVKNNK